MRSGERPREGFGSFSEPSGSAVRVRHRPPAFAAPTRRFCRQARMPRRLPGLSLKGRSDRFLQFLGGAEGDLLAGLDLNGLAGRRVAAHAGGALSHLQDAEAADANSVALLQVLGDEVNEAAEHRLGLLLRKLMILG